MTAFPALTPSYIDDQMFYRDFCILTQHLDDLERAQRRGASRGR